MYPTLNQFESFDLDCPQSGIQEIGPNIQNLPSIESRIFFQSPFSKVPVIHCQVISEGRFEETFVSTIKSSSVSGFVVTIRKVDPKDNGGWNQKLQLSWIARPFSSNDSRTIITPSSTPSDFIPFQVQFPQPFQTIPHVFVTPHNDETLNNDDTYVVQLSNVTCYNFSGIIRKVSHNYTGWTSTIGINWSAIHIQNPDLKFRTVLVGVGANSTNSWKYSKYISFGQPFIQSPIIIVTTKSSNPQSDCTIVTTVKGLTNQGFYVQMSRYDPMRGFIGWNEEIVINYLAEEPQLNQEFIPTAPPLEVPTMEQPQQPIMQQPMMQQPMQQPIIQQPIIQQPIMQQPIHYTTTPTTQYGVQPTIPPTMQPPSHIQQPMIQKPPQFTQMISEHLFLFCDNIYEMYPDGRYTKASSQGGWSSITLSASIGDKIYCISKASGNLFSWDPKTKRYTTIGKARWSKATAMVALNGMLIIFCNDAFRLDPITGVATQISQRISFDGVKVAAAVNGTIYCISTSSGKFYKFDAMNGTLVVFNQRNWSRARLMCELNNQLYVVTNSIYRIDLMTGNDIKIGTQEIWGAINAGAGFNNSLYLVSGNSGKVYAFNVQSGQHTPVNTENWASCKSMITARY